MVLEVHAGLEPGSTDQGGRVVGDSLWEVLARITGAARRGCHQKKAVLKCRPQPPRGAPWATLVCVGERGQR